MQDEELPILAALKLSLQIFLLHAFLEPAHFPVCPKGKKNILVFAMSDLEAAGAASPSGSPTLRIDTARDRYPYCVVWTSLPLITWIFPFIGHTGICSSAGITYDFAGPYTINEDNLAFGRPLKYWQLSPSGVHGDNWDAAVSDGCKEYRMRMHNLCCDNCHSHVAFCLNRMQYQKKTDWTMFTIGIMMMLRGRYVSYRAMVLTWLPFVCFVVLLALVLHFFK
eukprot:m.146174 g.146174  ORF g.146174 m.146174 type:complete len:223 (+) comp20521_c0_seq2:1219-1887(+)